MEDKVPLWLTILTWTIALTGGIPGWIKIWDWLHN